MDGGIYSPLVLNAHHPLAAGLVGAWFFDPVLDGGPFAWDSSGRNFHGTTTGAAAWEPGPFGLGGFKASTTGGYFNCGNSSQLNLVAGGWFSGSVNYRNTSISGGTTRWLFGRDATGQRAYAYGTLGDGRVQLQINGSAKATSTATPIATGKWHRVFCAGGANFGWRVYADGVFLASGTWTAPNSTTSNLELCRRGFADGQWNGTACAFLMSSTAPASAADADRVAAWDFQEWVGGYQDLFAREQIWAFDFDADGFLLLQTGGTDNLLLQGGDDLLLQAFAETPAAGNSKNLLLLGVG